MEHGRKRAAPVKQKCPPKGRPKGRNVVSLWALPTGNLSHLVAEATGRLTSPTPPQGRPPVGEVTRPLSTHSETQGVSVGNPRPPNPLGEGGAQFFGKAGNHILNVGAGRRGVVRGCRRENKKGGFGGGVTGGLV